MGVSLCQGLFLWCSRKTKRNTTIVGVPLKNTPNMCSTSNSQGIFGGGHEKGAQSIFSALGQGGTRDAIALFYPRLFWLKGGNEAATSPKTAGWGFHISGYSRRSPISSCGRWVRLGRPGARTLFLLAFTSIAPRRPRGSKS